MSKILLINGSPHQKGNTCTALNELSRTMNELGIETEILWLGTAPMQDCIGCFKCKEIKKCVFNDLVNETADRLDEFDGFVLGSPVYYAGPTGRLTSFMDRLFFSCDKSKLWGKLGASVVVCRRGGASASFDRLNKYFGINNMHIVGSQYWNSVHGLLADEAVKDEEGMQGMRTLAHNFAYLLKSMELAKKAGISQDVPEAFIATNFIR